MPALILFSALTSVASAAVPPLLNYGTVQPVIYADSLGTTSYNATTQTITVSATPLVISINGMNFFTSPRSFLLTAQIDNTGTLVAGTLSLTGTVSFDSNGDGTNENYSGVLLTGTVTNYGSQYTTGLAYWDFLATTTGGALATIYGSQIYVQVTSGKSTYNGSFASDFSGGAKTSISVPFIPACTTGADTTIGSNFNGTAIAAGDYIWFNAHISSLNTATPKIVRFTNQHITFTANSVNYDLAVPDAELIISPSVTTPTATFTTKWEIRVPVGASTDIFISGLSFPVPAGGLPGGINPVDWSGTMESNVSNISFQWQWAAAVYTSFTTDYNALGVQVIDGTYQAGTPVNYRTYVTGGARGGGGSNYTGSNSATGSGTICPPTPDPVVLRGDANGDGRINVIDMIFVRNRLNADVLSGDNSRADINRDGKINILDLIAIRNSM